MGIDIIKVVVGFWVFILGAMFMAEVLGIAGDKATLVIVVLVAAVIYIAFQIIRARRK
jgi:hypothetical protein